LLTPCLRCILLGNTILVKLELWESVIVIIIFGLPLTYAYATLRQSVAGNSTFRGIVFCNLGTPKTVISNFVTLRQRDPISFPIWLPQQCSHGTKKRLAHKKVYQTKCINSFRFFWGGAYGSLPDAAIWWCLRTGGGGVLTSTRT
jgi:hypothetical protein